MPFPIPQGPSGGPSRSLRRTNKPINTLQHQNLTCCSIAFHSGTKTVGCTARIQRVMVTFLGTFARFWWVMGKYIGLALATDRTCKHYLDQQRHDRDGLKKRTKSGRVRPDDLFLGRNLLCAYGRKNWFLTMGTWGDFSQITEDYRGPKFFKKSPVEKEIFAIFYGLTKMLSQAIIRGIWQQKISRWKFQDNNRRFGWESRSCLGSVLFDKVYLRRILVLPKGTKAYFQ